ncbi:MAG: 5'-nucleotidase C-terminal domain-containing protein [Candidatus Delongbacteria bacterium]|nr:5'-nucleotidase C-terminal domain-containing protein [Candidatus Delongbacteria bacterium]
MQRYLILLWLGLTAAGIAAPFKLAILFTNDEHGELLPYDFIRQKPKPTSLIHCASLIRQYRADYPLHLLLSAGDTYQGSPLAYYFHYRDSLSVHPMLKAMNTLGYDAWVPGNHDIEQGLPFLKKIETQAEFDCISANIRYLNHDSLFFKPYVIKQVGPVKIAILGLTTPAIPLWLTPDLYQGVQFDDMILTAEKWVDLIRKRENPDLLIGLFHSGMNQEWDSAYCVQRGIPLANPTLELARRIPDFDLIICAHSHKLINDTINEDYRNGGLINKLGKTSFAQARAHGSHLGVCLFHLDSTDKAITIDSISVKTVSAYGIQPDSGMLTLFQQEHRVLQNYVNDSIGNARHEISARSARIHDNPLIDLIHSAQLEISGADLSIAAVFNDDQRIPPGKITVADLFRLYPYENTMVKTKMSGYQIKAYLEYNARFFQTVDSSTRSIQAAQLFNPDIRSYNFDTIEGLNYILDITQPLGRRVTSLSYPQGSPVRESDTLSVVMNSYRFSGGGGFIAALGVPSLPLVESIPLSVRDMLIDYIRSHPSPAIDCSNNWKLYPDSIRILYR